jgi:hypothetical protein
MMARDPAFSKKNTTFKKDFEDTLEREVRGSHDQYDTLDPPR